MRLAIRAALLAAFVCTPFAAVLAPRAALAQEELPPPADPDADWQEAFQRGIDLLHDHKMDDAIKAFERARQVKADREPALIDYNVACAYAQKKDVAKTVERLKKAFDGGFLDLEHVGRDTDLDPVRGEEKFTALFNATKKKVLDKRAKAVRIVPKAESKGPRPLVVFLTATGDGQDDAAEKLGAAADDLGAVLLIPGGRKGDGGRQAWDSSAETCVVADVTEALADATLDVDPARVVLVGQLGSASVALRAGLYHGWKHVVGAAGVYSLPEAATAKDARVYLLAPRGLAERAQTEATAVRDLVLSGGGQVTVERIAGKDAFGPDMVATFERGVRWVLGEKVKVPGEGEGRRF